MRKKNLLRLGMILAMCSAGVGGWAYKTHHAVQQTGQAVYHALEYDGMPLPTGVLDDPVFKVLPPPDEPVSLGRYLPPQSSPSAARGQKPVSADDSKVPKPQPAAKATAVPDDDAVGSTTSVQGTQEKASPPVSVKTEQATAAAPVRSGPFLATSATVPLAQQKIHILLIGNDQKQLGHGRGDTLLALTFDPKARTLYMLSIPRDTRVDLPGHGWVKINAAYAYGGANLQTMAVERFLGIPFDKYVEVSLGGFIRAIDAVGGVAVNSMLTFDLDGQHIDIGPQRLGGEAALAYTRMRYEDPEGDLGRNRRQQEVIRALMNSLGRLNTTELTRVLQKLSESLRTNFSPSEVVRLRTEHAYMLDHQTPLTVEGYNRKIAGQWFYIVSEQERQRLHLLLR